MSYQRQILDLYQRYRSACKKVNIAPKSLGWFKQDIKEYLARTAALEIASLVPDDQAKDAIYITVRKDGREHEYHGEFAEMVCYRCKHIVVIDILMLDRATASKEVMCSVCAEASFGGTIEELAKYKLNQLKDEHERD